MSFFMQYIRHPRSVGAIKASSAALARRMTACVPFETAQCIVELGAGAGAFTKEVLRTRKEGTLVLVFEINDVFYRQLCQAYGHLPHVHILHDSAERLEAYLEQYGVSQADCILSGLPFASLPAQTSARILRACRRRLVPGAPFITFQYTRLKLPLLRRYFSQIDLCKVYRNLPPAYVLCCRAPINAEE